MRVVRESEGAATPAAPENFAGEVMRTSFIESVDGGLSALRFSYAPGSRSHWHVHDEEQALLAVEGRGLVAWEGGEGPRTLEPGDWVYVEPGVPHWHGATPDSAFAHLAVTAGGGTDWRGPVSEDDYVGRSRTSP
jgi:quercetin dioxygenase-like cupin family protein